MSTSSDVSAAIGACYITEKKFNKKAILLSITNFYWGQEYSNQEVEKFLKKTDYDKKYKVSCEKKYREENSRVVK